MSKNALLASSTKVKGLILAGGKGTRLHPLTVETNKHLLPIGDKSVIVRVVEQLLKVGIKDILLLIDEKHASQFMEVLKDGSDLGIRSLAYIWQSSEGRGLPTAISQIEKFINGEKIIVVCGDVLIERGIKKAVSDFLKQEKGARIIAAHMKDTAGYSLLKVKGERITKIFTKDKQRHKSGLIDLGIYMYHSDVFKNIKKLNPSTRGETEIWDLNSIYADRGELDFTTINGWWSDIGGGIETYLKACKRYEEEKR